MSEKYTIIGKRGAPHGEGLAKVTGKALYTRDIKLPRMLYAKMLVHPNAHSRIKSIDISEAESLPGVVSILKYDDNELLGLRPLFAHSDWWSLQTTEYWHWVEECNIAVCAESEEVCDEALNLIHIEWEQLPFCLTSSEALAKNAPLLRDYDLANANLDMLPLYPGGFEGNVIRDFKFGWGDIEKGFQEADTIVEKDLSYEYIEYCAPEPDCCIVDIRDNDETVFYIQEQQGHDSAKVLRSYTQLPMSKIRVEKHYCGGSYGLRHVNFHGRFVMFALLLARKTRRPIKMMTDRTGDWYYHDGKLESCKVKIGVKNDGKITALSLDSINPGGLGILTGASWWSKNTNIANFSLGECQMYVSNSPVTANRCELNNGAYAFSSVFQLASAAVGVDPTQAALLNARYTAPESLIACINTGKEAIDWDNNWHSPGSRKLPNGKYHGLGFTWTHEWDGHQWSASGGLRICADGSVVIMGSITDFGHMPMTPIKMMCAETLGVKLEDVHFPTNQDSVSFLWEGMGGSCCLNTNSMVMKPLAEKAKRMLLERAVEPIPWFEGYLPPAFDGLKPDDLDVKDSMVFEKANPNNKKDIPTVLGWSENPSPAARIGAYDIQVSVSQGETESAHEIHDASIPSTFFQAHFVEVEVDAETGLVDVVKIVNCNDIGQAIFPEGVESQQIGGDLMAWGRGLIEEPVYDPPTGVLLNNNLLDYKYATMRDCGQIVPIYLEVGLGGPGSGAAAYGNVGVGEDNATVIPAVIQDAINNALGTSITSLPITPTKILKALGKI